MTTNGYHEGQLQRRVRAGELWAELAKADTIYRDAEIPHGGSDMNVRAAVLKTLRARGLDIEPHGDGRWMVTRVIDLGDEN